MGIATSGLPWVSGGGSEAKSCSDELWGWEMQLSAELEVYPVPAGGSGVRPQMAKGEGLAVPFSWQTLFSWSCRVPVSVGEDLAPCHSRS